MPASHLTPWFSRYISIVLLFLSAWVNAQTWPEAHVRGTSNNWAATAMSWNTTTGLWEAQLAFSGTNPRFKISRYANNWNEAYPGQDYPVTQGDGDYKITFDDATKVISLSKVAQTLSPDTICYNNAGNHANPTIYFWNPVPSGSVSPLPAWPGSSMTRRGNFFCYDFSALLSNGMMPTSMGVIFSNNGSAQTNDLTFNGAGCYEDGNWKSLQQCGFALTTDGSSSSSVASQSSSASQLSSSQASSVQASSVEDSSANSPSSSSSPISSSSVSSSAISATRIYFYNSLNYTAPHIHYFNVAPAQANTNWPGVALTALGDGWYSYDFAAQINTAGIVFSNNGTPQTQNLQFNAPLNCYRDGVWQTPEQCGAPIDLTAPFNFPITGNVSGGDYRFEKAYPNLDDQFPSPVMVLPDGVNDVIYVVDKVGTIFVFPNDETVTKPEVRTLLNINNVVRNYHEQGLLSMAFDPDYVSNGYFYIYYIHGTDDNERAPNGQFGDAILERWTVDDPYNPTAVVPDSRVEILRVPQPGPDHKGGMMQFHTEEHYLYLSIGDGAYGHSAITSYPVDPRTNNNAQITSNLLGTMIRIELLDTPVDGKYYAVPPDNPFVGNPDFRPEIWSYGHRNPWRWAFDPDAPYTIWQTEVGQSGFEEVNLIQKGKNYGWPVCEGLTNRGDLGGDPAKNCSTDFEPPRDGYNHPTGYSIIGGVVYRGNKLPGLTGRFIFGDYVTKRLWSIVDGEAKQLISEAFPENIVSFGTDLSGEELLVSTYGVEYGGRSTIYRVVDDAAQAAEIPEQLSATGLFADLENLTPVNGVVEYALNSNGWFDGAQARHFMAIPNNTTIGFDPTQPWDLPVGSVLVKHLSIATENNPQQPFTTSVLFRQDSGWQAANYHWNAAGTDANLVTETINVMDGGMINRERAVQSAADCGSCHVGSGSKDPLAANTRQLNRTFDYQGVSDNQLAVFDRIGLFSEGIDHPVAYEQFAALDDATADLAARVKAYADTNCAHCHNSSFMDMQYDTPLADMRWINQATSGGKYRVRPGSTDDSVVYIYQTSDGNRMPKGSRYTNPVAEAVFAEWINGLDTSGNSSSSSSSSSSSAAITAIEIAPATVALSDEQQLVAYGVRSDGTRVNLYGQVSWQIISGAGVASVSTNGLLTRLAAGTAEVEAYYQGMTAPLTVAGSAPGLQLRFDNAADWANVRIYVWTVVNGANQVVAPWPGVTMNGPDADGWWTYIVEPESLHNGAINVIFTNGSGAQTPDLSITTSASYSFASNSWTPWNPDGSGDNTLYRLSVIGGSTTDNERDFRPGTVVTIAADEAPYGTTFAGWTGDGLPYVFTDPTQTEVQLVVPAHGLSLQALFEGDIHGPARDLYAGQCASCHGEQGKGGVAAALDNLHESSAWTVELLADYISVYMPMGTANQCTGTNPGDCAYDIASMIIANAWDAPDACSGTDCPSVQSLDARNLRLLTRTEYLNSVRDIFGIAFPDNLMTPVPADGRLRNFETASFLIADNERTLGYEMVAAEVADQAITDKGFLGLAPGCGDQPCVVELLGKKLFRRPLSNDEVSTYTALYDSTDAGRTLVQALLMSPHFMYRSELGAADTDTGLYRLTDYEIATLLAYTFWVTTPDENLLAAADAGTLDIAAQVERLLADPRAERGLRRFASGWLIDNQYGFAAIQSPTLIAAFKEETLRFVVEAIKENKPFNELLTANYTWVNAELAAHYGMPAVTDWTRSFHTSGEARSGAGLLGHGAFLASRTNTVNPAPIKRGVYVRQALMCQEFPPPAAADFNVVFEPSDSNRDATARHTSDPACASCHQFIDGVGFGFESFGSDALFRTIETLGNGDTRAVDASGAIKSLNSPETTLDPNSPAVPYNTIPELAALIADSGQGAACYSRQFYRYTLGRNETQIDEPIIRAYSADLRAGGGMRDMLIDLTLSDSFILRR